MAIDCFQAEEKWREASNASKFSGVSVQMLDMFDGNAVPPQPYRNGYGGIRCGPSTAQTKTPCYHLTRAIRNIIIFSSCKAFLI
jgi:hypothetical protein